jgi:hypothetical protein
MRVVKDLGPRRSGRGLSSAEGARTQGMAWFVSTTLVCESCGKRCGTAHRGDHGQGLTRDDIVVDFRYDLDEKPPHQPAWRDSRRDVAAMIFSLAKHIDAWPMIWACEHCRTKVRFDLDRAHRVGRARRLVVPVVDRMSLDS